MTFHIVGEGNLEKSEESHSLFISLILFTFKDKYNYIYIYIFFEKRLLTKVVNLNWLTTHYIVLTSNIIQEV